MKTSELRGKFLDFFESKGHTRVRSDALVPKGDPSVLFTPAGMNQFKDHFLGKVKLDYTKATTCQKCLRTGDIENVGRTAYHHTFFEMLGNFSFGDYFKRDAINWAWEFLTDSKWLGIKPERLSVTVYLDDDEAANIWKDDVGLTASKIERMDEHENFWPAGAPSNGPDGVCGPCSEIFYHDDFGDTVEIWNLVFTQFNRVGDPPDNLRPLPSKNIDTGMGLERTAASLQGVETNYHIDILLPIVEAAAEVVGKKYDPKSDDGRRLRRITDHVRACTFSIHENVFPGPNKEKYVIRRLLRRAVLDGHQLGRHDPFLYQLVPSVIDAMKDAYPELTETVDKVTDVIKQEETSFFGTIDGGLARIERIFSDMESANRVLVDGDSAADLYQTHGVPPELFESLAAERNFTFDWDGFRAAMEKHGEISGGGRGELFKTGPIEALKRALHATQFVGYDTTEADCTIQGIVAQDQLCDQLEEVGHDQAVIVVLDRSPFYAESGGQVGDSGEIVGDGFRFEVTDTQKDSDLILHTGHLAEGRITAGSTATARVDDRRRQAIRRAHSATHIMHYALQKNLGKHAQQQGSKVDDDWLRFDFTNMSPVEPDQIAAVERDVTERVAADEPIGANVTTMDEARQAGAMMLFGEKYGDEVRMVRMGDFSRELCGGTHLSRTGEVGPFEIISEESVSAGTRRIVALTGNKAKDYIERTKNALAETAEKIGVPPAEVPHALKRLTEQVRDLRKQLSSGTVPSTQDDEAQPAAPQSAELDYPQIKAALRDAARILNVSSFDVPQRAASLLAELKDLKQQLAQMSQGEVVTADSLIEQAETVGDSRLIVGDVQGAPPNLMRQLIDQVRKKVGSSAVLLASTQGNEKVVLVAGVSKDLVDRGLSAGNWVKQTAAVVGGGGGGKPDMAQAGGRQPEKLPEAIEKARQSMKEWLAA